MYFFTIIDGTCRYWDICVFEILFSANINGTRHYMDIRYVCISFPRFWH